MLPLVIPIFLAAFKLADELSLAMEARGYRTDVKRTRKKYAPWGKNDWLAPLLCAALAAAYVVLR